MDTARQKMLDELMAADFVVEDLELYLNTHPSDQRAVCIYMNCVQKAQWLRCCYERMYGPITATANRSCQWLWIDNPWPWDWQ